MNEFISPHQNININISYNLGASDQKVPKVVFGKKIHKVVKLKEELDAKNYKKGQIFFTDDKKPITMKNNKNKKVQNFFTSYEEPPKRFKTQGNISTELISTYHKKEGKNSTKTFSKSVWQNKSCTKQNSNLTKSATVKKQSKVNKKDGSKNNRNQSCILYPSKKHVISDVDHIVSLVTEPKVQNKKRANSASVISGNKFVDKLLNMSVLASELGGSIALQDEAGKISGRSKYKNNLQDYLNSLDMRVVKNMKNDKIPKNSEILTDLMIGQGLQLINFLNKIRRIPMQTLHTKATIIQRFWKQKVSESILPYYKDLFKNAARGMQTIHTQLSNIDICHNFSEDGLSSINNGNNNIENISEEEQIQEGEDEENYFFEGSQNNFYQNVNFESNNLQFDKNGDEDEGLNIKKYQQLVKRTIEENKGYDKNGITKQKNNKEEVSSTHWNHVHNLLSNNINHKAPIISNVVLEELMKQSVYNKQWLEGDFSSDSRKLSLKQSPRIQKINQSSKQKQEKQQEQEVKQENNENVQNEEIDGEREGDGDQFSECYNWSKYSDISNLKKAKAVSQEFNSLPAGINKEIPSNNVQFQSQSSQNEENSAKQWTRNNVIQEDAIVSNYLDCGLDNFGLKMNTMLQNARKSQQHHKNTEQQNQHKKQCEQILFSSNEEEQQDEEQQAEVIYVFRNQQQNAAQNNSQQHINKVVSEQIHQQKINKVIEDIIFGLLEQFAYDVSNILKKSHINKNHNDKNNSKIYYANDETKNKNCSKKLQVNSLGICTNFQTIRDFITKLKEFILGDVQHTQKVIANLKNNIGPSSLQILSYLRVQAEEEVESTKNEENQIEEETEEWLFVVPNELFEIFSKNIIQDEEKVNNSPFTNRMKLYKEFWHRSIFECYNECLDYERPFGITGAPYNWITQQKMCKKIQVKRIKQILENAENRILDLSFSSSGIIFDKIDSPYRQFGLNEQSKIQLNEQRISRMLANQILDDEYNWITYNDEITELIVDISRKIEEIIIFQLATDLKKVVRKRKNMVAFKKQQEQQQDQFNQQITFEIDEL